MFPFCVKVGQHIASGQSEERWFLRSGLLTSLGGAEDSLEEGHRFRRRRGIGSGGGAYQGVIKR